MTAVELRKLRQEARLTQELLAEQLGVDRRTLGRWEKGYPIPRIAGIAIKLVCKVKAKVINIDPDILRLAWRVAFVTYLFKRLLDHIIPPKFM